MCVLIFSKKHFFETFLILSRNGGNVIKMCICLHVKYPSFLSDFNEICPLSMHIRNLLKYKIS